MRKPERMYLAALIFGNAYHHKRNIVAFTHRQGATASCLCVPRSAYKIDAEICINGNKKYNFRVTKISELQKILTNLKTLADKGW